MIFVLYFFIVLDAVMFLVCLGYYFGEMQEV